jgi:hypothetical protein
VSGRKVLPIGGGRPTSPNAFCAMLYAHAEDIEHIACVIQWKRNEKGEPSNLTTVAATQMTIAELVWLKHVFDADILSEHPEPEPRRPNEAA